MAKTLVIKGADFSANKLATVNFSGVPCTGISLDIASAEINTIGGTQSLTATITPSDTTDAVGWGTSNDSVATVSNGVVTAIGLGTAVITATCGNYSATCSITVDNVIPDYVAICGYAPFRRSDTGPAATTDKRTTATNNSYIVAKDQATGLYPIESKTDVDTNPYRFVPIAIPAGAKSIIVSNSIGNFYTRFTWFDSTKQETQYNVGAYCVSGTQTGYDQTSSIPGPFSKNIPTGIQGLDSFCIAITTGGTAPAKTTGEDYSAEIQVVFSKDDAS